MNEERLRSGLFGRLLSEHGMVLVLLILCGFFSVMTYSEQQPTGDAAARQVARELTRQLGNRASQEAHVLIATRSHPEDTVFAERLAELLRSNRGVLVDVVKGEPKDALQALRKLAERGQKLQAIATYGPSAQWLVFAELKQDFPALGDPRVFQPRSQRWPIFLKRENLLNIANQIAVIAIIAVGMTVVIISGGIDLSVGSLIALSAVVSCLLIREFAGATQAGALGMSLSCLAAVLVCAMVGLTSGAVITRFSVPPFIVTLGVMLMARGLAARLTQGQSVYQVPDSFTWLGRGADLAGVPNAVVLMAILYGMAHVMMSRTKLGRYLYAVGGNTEAARLSGVPVQRIQLFAYTLAGLLAGLGGVVMASQLRSAAPNYGLMYELYVIAAVVVGGTSLSGGEGRIFGTLIGAFIIAVIWNGMNLMNVEAYTQMFVLGFIIVLAVLLDRLKSRS